MEPASIVLTAGVDRVCSWVPLQSGGIVAAVLGDIPALALAKPLRTSSAGGKDAAPAWLDEEQEDDM